MMLTPVDNRLQDSGLIQIGEMIHASIPTPGAAMKSLHELGAQGFDRPNRGLAVMQELIRSQVEQGAFCLDINLDALNAANAPELMQNLVRLVHREAGGVPPCVDSSELEVLMAGLQEWFTLGKELAPPVVNSIPFVDMDKFGPVYELRAEHRFNAICLLVGPEGPLKSDDAMFEAAQKMFHRAKAAGFRPDEIFFDTVTLGMTTDGCIDATGRVKPSHTHNAFRAIRRIRKDPAMKGVHAILGVSNWGFGVKKRRIGHIRAFTHVAQTYGLDAVIADVSRGLGLRPPAQELVELVELFAALDGAEDSMRVYLAEIQQARRDGHL